MKKENNEKDGITYIRNMAMVNKLCAASFRLKNGGVMHDDSARIVSITANGYRLVSSVDMGDFEDVTFAFADGDSKVMSLCAKEIRLSDYATADQRHVYDCSFSGESVIAKKFLRKRSRQRKK
jgi:hypothetical protein